MEALDPRGGDVPFEKCTCSNQTSAVRIEIPLVRRGSCLPIFYTSIGPCIVQIEADVLWTRCQVNQACGLSEAVAVLRQHMRTS
jgi:hypothetical protein